VDSFEKLREQGGFIVSRGRRDGDGLPVLLLVPATGSSLPANLVVLQRVWALREDLDSSWAVRPVELVEVHGRSALLMEDPGGEFLGALIGRPLAVPEFLRLAIGISTALGGLHGRDLVHKDIKPANFVVKIETGEAWLTGFGLASRLPRHRQSPESPEVIAGTLAYMAPEQTGRMNRSIDSRSDLYSLGMTLYEMLVGGLPFTASDPLEWVHCHIARQPISPSERVNSIPKPISAIIMKLLAKAPEERYQTAAGVEADLRHCLSTWKTGGQIEAFPLGVHDVPDHLLIPEKLYGREKEIELLLAAFDRVVKGGATELVLVSGYSGVGKSSVINELHKVLVAPRGLFASGKFDQYKRDIPYATLAQAFQMLVRQILTESDAEVIHWRNALLEALGPNGRLIVNLVPEIELIIGDQPAVAELPPKDAQNRFQMVFRRTLSVFAQPEHPLALFLDDLQWLDAATLDLLQHLITHDEVRHLLLIGAYRDNEVSLSHPLTRTLAEIQKVGAPVHQIALANLGLDDVTRLVADSLHCTREAAHSLAELVHVKTGGNPFFAIQFISALEEEGLLAFSAAATAWRWDIDHIRAKGFTENVVDLMVTKLSRLPPAAQNALQQLACLGNSAPIATLITVYGGAEVPLHTALWDAVRPGLVSCSADTYSFVHDRIQEAAYVMIPEERRAAEHLRIGKLLLSRAAESEIEEKIFDIVNQLNRGSKLIVDSGEKAALMRLNILAGGRAKAAIAHSSAGKYLRHAVALLPPDAWERHYQQTFELYLAFSECEYLVGNFANADALFDLILRQSASDLDRARVFSLRMRLYQVAGKYDDGVAVALDALRLFGVTFPETDQDLQAAIATEFGDIRVNLAGRAIGDLLNAPIATDPEVLAIINLLVEAAPCSYIGRPRLFPLITLKAVNSSLRSGNTDQSSFAYAVYAVMLISVVGDIASAFQFSEMSLRLNEKFDNARLTGTLLHLHFDHINFWRRPFATGLPMLEQAFLACLEVGDLVYAGFLAFESVWQLIEKGAPLDEVLVLAAKSAAFARQSHNDPIHQTIRVEQQFVASLQGRTSVPFELDENGFDEAACFESIVNATFGCGIFFYHAIKQILAFLDGRYGEALDFAAQAEPTLGAAMSMPIEATYHFFHALTLTALYPSLPSDQQLVAGRTLEVKLQKLKLWADNCPENYYNRHALVSAEVARIEHRDLDAMRGYDDAIRSARENGLVQNEALANELAGLFYAGKGFETIAQTYLRKASYCYERWGAAVKVRQLEERYPRLREELAPSPQTVMIGARAEHLDVGTVVKASQALSSEMFLPQLIEKLMRTAVEYAGAERGLLVLLRGDEPRIEAEATTGYDTVRVCLLQVAASSTELPESILRYVIRSQDSVILDDALIPNSFSMDAYIQRRRARSVLCLPLVKQVRLIGVLYLENNLSSYAFTPARIAVLQLLASQAAISLENARLYLELQQAEEKARQSEREFRLAIDMMPALAWNTLADGSIETFNKQWHDYTGISAEGALGGGWTAAFHPDDRGKVADTWEKNLASGGSSEIEARMRRFDGEYRWFLLRMSPLLDENGNILKWYGTNSDIDDLKRAEALLAGEKRIFEMIATGHTLPVIFDALCRIVEELNGGSPTSVLLLDREGKRLRNGAAPNLPDRYTKAIDGIRIGPFAGSCGTAAYRKEKVLVSDISTDPLWADYRALALEHGLRACWSTPILSAEAKVLGTIAIYSRQARSMTLRENKIIEHFTHLASIAVERKRAEDALKKSEAFLAEGQRISHTGSWAWNLATDQVIWSEEHCRIFGYRPDEVGGTFAAILDRMLPEDRLRIEAPIAEAVEKGRDYRVEYRIIMPDGSVKFNQSVGRAIANESGEVTEYIGTTADITERKRAEEELRRSEAGLRKAQAELAHVTRVTTMGELAASIAHEVNQPIAGVVLNGNACLRWLARVKEDSANLMEARDAVERIIRDGTRAGEVIARIRALFKKAEATKEPLDLNEVVREVIVLARSEMDKRRIALRLKLASNLPRILGDRVQLQQVLLNLILNGIEAMSKIEERRRELILGTHVNADSEVLVTVRDFGVGLDPESTERAFTAFHTTKPGGLGMGLPISRSIVENHAGRLWATANDGPGATFQFTLSSRPSQDGPDELER
jgi:PAS domain S-box-containing protein